MIESLLYAKMPPHLKRSIYQAYFENGTYVQIVRHLEREMELNGLESEDTGVKTQMTVINKQAEEKPTQQKPATTKRSNKHRKQCPTIHCKMTNVVIAKTRGTRQQTALN